MNFDHLRHRSFAARYLTLFGGETFSKLCVLAAFAYMAWMLPPSDYGIVELALSITVFFVLGVESGMGLYGARIVAASPERMSRLVPQVMLLRAVLALPAFALMLGVAIHYRPAGLGLLAINAIAVLLTPFLTQWVFQGLRQMQWIAAGSVARNFTFVALILILIRPGSDLRLVAVAEVCGIAVLAVLNTWILYRRLHARLDWRGVIEGTRRLFGDVWYMGLSDFTWACLWYSPALIIGWLGVGTEQVAWIAVAVRIVLALHTFVWLYFFNMLPNMAKELASGVDNWRDLMKRSMATSMWPACLAAVGGTLIAPLLIPLVYGDPYVAAVRPLQIVIWLIPLTWFSGHFRFSLIAAGHQRWEFAVSAATAVVTVTAAFVLGRANGSVGAATALLIGGVANTLLAVLASNRYIGSLEIAPSVSPALLAMAVSLATGIVVAKGAGVIAGTATACAIYLVVAIRQDHELSRMVRRWAGQL